MMEINITKFFNEAAPRDFAASAAERGQNVGKETWQAAQEEAADEPIMTTPEQFEAMRYHLNGFGAWEREEIAAWSDVDLNALLIQLISGDIREVPDMDQSTWDWDEYERLAQAGTSAGRMFKGDDGEVYYTLGD